jgi:hypothetical protein
MANFNLNDYELVETRIGKFYALYEDGRIITTNETTPADREKGLWVIRTAIFTCLEDFKAGAPKATGFAFEQDGGSGASRFSALENCETSSIGRALANMGLHGNKRASRSEMEKVQRAETVKDVTLPPAEKWAPPLIKWEEEISALKDANGARGLYALAKAEKAPQKVLDAITAKGQSFTSEGK